MSIEKQSQHNELGNLADLLLHRARSQPGDTAYVFHDYSPRADRPREQLTFGELVSDATAIASMLQASGLQGQSVLLLFGAGLDFIRAYCGCLLAGAHAVPLRPPLTPEYARQLSLIARNARARAALCPGAIAPRVRTLLQLDDELRGLPVLSIEDRTAATGWVHPGVQGDDIALIQYTSGSTGLPKGVVVSHANLLRNEAAICEAFGHDRSSVVAGWLPMFHDMGLIGNVLQSLYLGVPSILMDPLAFLQKPARWLQLITQYRATTGGGPNFGYELCVNRIKPEEIDALDLSSWSLAFTGAEPVRMHTLARFADTFARAGFRASAFYPCYGLAEATLFVTGIDKRKPASSLSLDAAALRENIARISEERSAANLAELVACGYPRGEHIVRIVDPQTRVPCADGAVGEIWVAGASVARGYFGQPELTREVFAAELSPSDGRAYLRTGDLGFLRDGQLYVSGRIKDLIIIRGINHYPQDIEATALSAHDSLRPSCGAAFSIEHDGEEKLVLVHEVKHQSFELAELVELVRAAIVRRHGLQLHDLVLVGPRAVPKTSSGKLQRRRCRSLYQSGDLRRLSVTVAPGA